MESINGISFEDWAAACGHMAQGMTEEEVSQVLGIEPAVWADTNNQWAGKLGDLMTEDMNVATTYGEIFANPKVGKFAQVEAGVETIDDLLKRVPDHDTYLKIFWHQSKGSEVGLDPVTILESYNLNLQQWGQLNMHYMNWFNNWLNEDLRESDSEEYNTRYQLNNKLTSKWQNHWEEEFKNQSADLSSDIEF